MTKLMKWAVDAEYAISDTYGVPADEDTPEYHAAEIEKAAEPLLAVVREVTELMEAEGEITFVRTDGGENKIGIAFANLRRVMPAALKAMEEADDG